MSHYSTSPRKSYVVLHHSGSPNTHTIEDARSCDFGSGKYDFAVTRTGRIFVCPYSSSQPMWKQETGQHGGSGCNCASIGILMYGCFGGCETGNVAGPSSQQKCSVAFLMAHLRSPDTISAVRPHANCASWNACGGGTGGTECPGTNFTSGTGWNDSGRSLRDQLRALRRNWDRCGNCSGEPCPV